MLAHGFQTLIHTAGGAGIVERFGAESSILSVDTLIVYDESRRNSEIHYNR